MTPSKITWLRASTRRARASFAPALCLAVVAAWGATPARAAVPPATRGPIATIGDRTVDALDIQRAATVLGTDPLRKKSPTQWRRMLLDRCVDRELLAMAAEKRGIAKDPDVRRRISEREFLRLYQVVHEEVLLPTLDVTPAQLDSLKRSGLYRIMDLYYILLRDNASQGRRKEAEYAVERLRQGARFDSLASIKSAHPSHANGGHFGPVLVRDIEPKAWEPARTAKVGDILGPYSGPFGHEIYKVGGFQELTDDSIRTLVRGERERTLIRDYQERLLNRYHFAVDSTVIKPFLFAVGTETPDSILASLGPDGTRPRHGVRPAIGVLARVDGDSLTFPELLSETHPAAGAGGRIRIRDAEAFRELAGEALFRRLLVRDAKERGLTDDPRVARELRLIADGTAVEAMIERASPRDPGKAALQTWFDAHVSRYRLPEARRARVAVFASQESALVSLRAWNGIGISDSSLNALRFTAQRRATPETLFPGHFATIDFFDRDLDPLSRAVRTLDTGQTSPVVRTAQGYAIARVLGRVPTRPMTLDEAIDRVRRDWREEKENEWVLSLVERMRATTPVRVVPARLEAVKLTPVKGSGASGSEASR